MDNPAENLVNITIESGWHIYEKIKKGPSASGGNFSICYRVRRGEHEAFLKAMDISRAFRSGNAMKALQMLTTAHNYEVELLQICRSRNMDKIISVIENGEVIPLENNSAGFPVPYIIFEYAERTIRDHILNISHDIDNACLMRSIHNVAVGIKQLHSGGIAHQDLKGSNVLMIDESGNSKISDLGRSENKFKQSLHFDFAIAGDPAYAAPELLYQSLHADWDVRRKATDLYQLGSIICFYYTKDSMTSLLKTFLLVDHCWTTWNGDYKSVLPYLQNAFDEAMLYLEDCLVEIFSEKKIVDNILLLVRYLCDPDPLQRGHPGNRMIASTRYSLERFISAFDDMSLKFESKLI